jgi:hypothetical protein
VVWVWVCVRRRMCVCFVWLGDRVVERWCCSCVAVGVSGRVAIVCGSVVGGSVVVCAGCAVLQGVLVAGGWLFLVQWDVVHSLSRGTACSSVL